MFKNFIRDVVHTTIETAKYVIIILTVGAVIITIMKDGKQAEELCKSQFKTAYEKCLVDLTK